jgi:thiol:disulfide interchange protein DsbD
LLTSGLYLLGVGMALTPCAPLSAILLGAAASASPLGGALLGLAFGLGACLAPGLVYGLGVAYFGQELRLRLGRLLPRFEKLAALMFIGLGLRQLLFILPD